jgi:hypothetical protein
MYVPPEYIGIRKRSPDLGLAFDKQNESYVE